MTTKRHNKHTPGPWYHDADDKLNPERAFGIVRPLGAQFDIEAGTEGATEVIAEVCSDDGSGAAEADARLIAAAPDLLALAVAFTEWHANHFEDFSSEINAELLCLANDAAAAIARATQPRGA